MCVCVSVYLYVCLCVYQVQRAIYENPFSPSTLVEPTSLDLLKKYDFFSWGCKSMVKYLVSTHRPWSSPDTADKSLPIAPEARLSFPDPFMGLQLSRQMSSVIREFFLT